MARCHSLLTPAQIIMARYGLKLTVRAVADMAGVSPTTVTAAEKGRDSRRSTLAALQEAFVSKGAEFKDDGWVRIRPPHN